MRETRITLPQLALVAGTRTALGAGLGLLLADRFARDQRKAIGWTLLLIGALTSIPLAFEVLGRSRLSINEAWPEYSESESESSTSPAGEPIAPWDPLMAR